jgi:hypothetical protein
MTMLAAIFHLHTAIFHFVPSELQNPVLFSHGHEFHVLLSSTDAGH